MINFVHYNHTHETMSVMLKLAMPHDFFKYTQKPDSYIFW